MITHAGVAEKIYDALNADATLKDANHLTSAGKIFNSPVRPTAFGGNAITLNLIPSKMIGEQNFAQEFLLLLNVYLLTLGDHSPDAARAKRVAVRVQTVLNDAVFSASEFSRLRLRKEIPEGFTGITGADGILTETFWTHSYFVTADE